MAKVIVLFETAKYRLFVFETAKYRLAGVLHVRPPTEGSELLLLLSCDFSCADRRWLNKYVPEECGFKLCSLGLCSSRQSSCKISVELFIKHFWTC